MAELPYAGLSAAGNVPNTGNPFGINRNAGNFAAATEAALSRANWDYSRAELQPLIARLQSMYTNPNGHLEAVQGAQRSATQGFDRSLAAMDTDMSLAGLSLTPDQQQARNQVSSLQRGLTETSAMNMASRGQEEIKQQIATGLNR